MKMKTNIIYLIIISICVALLVSSCATGKDSVVILQPTTEKQTDDVVSKIADCYVVMNNGAIRKYSKIKLVTGILITPYLLADGEIKILPTEIIAYKDANHYAISQKEFYNKNKTHVAINVLPGFAVRELKGDLNVYSLQYFNGSNIYKKYFLQKGNDGIIIPYSPQLLNDYATNNTEVKNFVTKKKTKRKDLIAIVENYNNSVSVSKN